MTPTLDPVLSLLLRAGLALLFASAAMHKLRDLPVFRASLAAYELVPNGLVRALSVLVLACEAAVAVALLAAWTSPVPPFVAGGLLLLYSSAIAINLVRGRGDIDCGCAGPKRRRPLGFGLVARNLVLLAAAVASGLPTAPRAFVWMDAITLVSGLAASCLLYEAIDGLLTGVVPVAPRQSRVASFEVQNG